MTRRRSGRDRWALATLLLAGVLSGSACAGGTAANGTADPPGRTPSTTTATTGTPEQPTPGGPPSPAEGFAGPVTVTVGDAAPLRAEVAHTPAQRAYGLMERDSLPAGTGMLFTFPIRGSSGFYMFRTRVPLSIAFVDGDRVVSVAEMTPCPAAQPDECPTYEPAGLYTMAVEAPSGYFTDAGVQSGDRVTVRGTLPPPE